MTGCVTFYLSKHYFCICNCWLNAFMSVCKYIYATSDESSMFHLHCLSRIFSYSFNLPEIKVKVKCERAYISYLKVKERERENSNKLCKTKLYYATRRHCICGQNKNVLCLRVAHIRSQAYDVAVHLPGNQWQCPF